MFNLPFSRRNKPAPDSLKYEISELVRHRVISNFRFFTENHIISVGTMFEDAAKRASMEYGGLHTSMPPSLMSDPSEIASDHFVHAPDERAIDFLEWCFQSEGCRLQQTAVDIVNKIFREEAIGYEFSSFVFDKDESDRGVSYHVRQYPEAIQKSNELVHSTTIMPTLALLAAPVFQIAEKEMMEAHQHFRQGDWTAAVNSAGQSLETVLKTICEKKRWSYTKDVDALGKLLGIVETNGLINDVQRAAVQKTSGEIRNKYGAHGKGPVPTYGFATAEIAEHMIQVTSAHILLLVRLAKM